MAILPCLPGIEVTIHAEGKPLKEYPGEFDEDSSTTTCYIEAKTDQAFAIMCKVDTTTHFRGNSLGLDCYVDGKWADSPVIRKENCQRQTEVATVNGIAINDHQLRPFRFSKLQISDEATPGWERSDFDKIGCIELLVRHVNAGSPSKEELESDVPANLESIPEKALKGSTVSHNVKLGDPIAQEYTFIGIRGTLIDPIDRPAGTFNFLYRSLDALKSMLIVPRAPTPPPLEYRALNSITVSDIPDMQRRLRERSPPIATIKEEKSHAITTLKREGSHGSDRPAKIRVQPRTIVVLELEDNGNFRESSTPVPTREKTIIELE